MRKAIFDFADAGRGLLLVHPALWYNWPDWPEYNRVLVGGGARSHDKYGEFEVTVDGKLVFSKKAERRFPEHSEVLDLLPA